MSRERSGLAGLQTLVSAKLAGRIGLAPEQIDPGEPFSRYGLDSVKAIAMIEDLGQELGRPLSATLAWTHPTVTELARHLAEDDRGTGEAAAPAAAGRLRDEPIAVVGLSCRFPGAPSAAAFWRLLREGGDAIREVPRERWDVDAFYHPDPGVPGTTNSRRGGFLVDIDRFDPLFFGISPREAAEMDPQQRIMLELTWEALEDAGVPPRDLAGTSTGVFFGVVWRDYADLHREARAAATSHTGVGLAPAIIPNRVSYALGLHGPSLMVDTACSSSLVTVHLACRSLREGESTVALAGGVNLMLVGETMVALTKFGGLSPRGQCRAFDADADGFVRGEGAGVVVLKPLSRALADGDRIYCLIRGSAVNNDGASNGLTAPNPQAQQAVLRRAYQGSGVDPGRVHYVETHGTGTPLGDPIEASALSAVLCAGREAERPLLIGSVKSNLGHLEGAAGIAGLIKVALSMRHRLIPPSLHFERPNPHIPFGDWRLRVQTALAPWPDEETPAMAGVSAFGWGGTNCHLVVEEMPARRANILPLAAASAAELQHLSRELREYAATAVVPLSELCAVARPGPAGHRLAVSVRSRRELVDRLDAFLAGQPRPRLAAGTAAGAPPKLVFVFSGLGSQWPGMGRDLLWEEPVFRAWINRCDEVFQRLLGWSVREQLSAFDPSGVEERWGKRSENIAIVQPVLFSLQVALAALWRSWGVEPDAVVGQSLGEVAAAQAAGALSLEDAARVIASYVQAQAPTVDRGGVAIIQLPAAEVEELLVSQDSLVVAGYNSPVSTLVSGDSGALDLFLAGLKARGVFCSRIRINLAAHSPHMDPVLDTVREDLAGIRPRRGAVPLVSNMTGVPLPGACMGPDHWALNLRGKVLFAQAVEWLSGAGHTVFLEVGPHPVLTGTVAECLEPLGREGAVLSSLRKGEESRGALFDSLAALWTRGCPVAWARLLPAPAVDPGADDTGREELLPLSARATAALQELAGATAARLRGEALGEEVPSLSDLCYSAALRRGHHEQRLAVVASSRRELADRLEDYARGDWSGGVVAGQAARERPRLVFAFCGQGAQWQGMERELLAREPVFRETFEECDELMRPHLGFSLLEAVGSGRKADALDATEVAQPALFAMQVGLASLWRSWGVLPDAVIGHSLGEVAAAHVAGILPLPEAARIIALRGRLMAPTRGRGRMASVGLPFEAAQELAAGSGGRLWIAALNSPATTVLAGEPDALAETLASLRERSVTCRELRVEYAFHSPQMERSAAELTAALRGLRLQPAELRFVSTVTGHAAAGTDLDAGYWGRNVREPVRFSAAVSVLAAEGSDLFLEMGPHPVLSVSISECAELSRATARTLPSLRRGHGDRRSLLASLGALYTLGYPVDWRGLHPEGGRLVSLPDYPFQRQRYWFEEGGVSMPAAPIHPASDRRGAVLSRLGSIFSELTGIPSARIDPGATFLQLGADSVVLLQGVRAIQDAFGVELSMRQLFGELSTLELLGAYVEAAMPAPTPAPSVSAAPAAAPTLPEAAGMEAIIERQLAAFSRGFTELAVQQLQALGGARPAVPLPPPAAPAKSESPAAFVAYQPLKVHERSELDARQAHHLERLIARYTRKTPRSKAATQTHRRAFSDNRSSAGFRPDLKEMLYPLIAERSQGTRIWDLDGNEYIDITMGFGVNLFGHRPPFIEQALAEQLAKGMQLGPQSHIAGEVAELICELTGAERVAFSNTGTEAVMTALRLARTVTGRRRVALFNGSYHGHFDGVLASPSLAFGAQRSQPMAPGVSAGAVDEILMLEYGDPRSLEAIRSHAGELAAVLVEPVQSRRPDLQPREFLHELRRLTEQAGTALIFDEVITGFRSHPGGAQAVFDVRADIAAYGKVLGGGMPIGVVAGASRFIDAIDGGVWDYGDSSYPRAQTTFFAGTFCKHPLAMAASRAVLMHLKEHGPALQRELAERTARLAAGLNAFFAAEELPIQVAHFSSLFRILSKHNLEILFYHLAENGVFVWEGRTLFLSTAHTDEDVEQVAEAVRKSVLEMRDGGFLPPRRRDDRELPSPPLTDAQRDIWVLAQLGAEASASCNNQVCLRLQGPLRVEALRQAASDLVGRHEALRTVFDPATGAPRLLPGGEPGLHVHMVPALDGLARDEAIDGLLTAEARRPFDLARGPLLRLALLPFDDEHLLVVGAHQIAADGWSFGVLLRELGALYTARVTGRPATLPEPTPFRSYAERELLWLQTADAARSEAWWLERLAGPLPVLRLPGDRPRPVFQTYAGADVHAVIEPGLREDLQRLAAGRGCTLFMVLLAAFQALLHRLTGQEDLLVVTPSEGQAFDGGPAWVGDCLNLLPLRTGGGGDPAFGSYLERVKQMLLETFEHQRYPFARLLARLTPAPDPSRWPLFNLDQRLPLPALPGIAAELRTMPRSFSSFELGLNVLPSGDRLDLTLEYKTDLFDRETVRRWMGHLDAILRRIAGSPEEPLSALSLAGEAERRQLLHLVEGPQRPPFLAPRTPVEERLAELWEEVLCVDRVGLGDNFFQLGGHSLLATHLASRIRTAFAVGLPLRSVLEAPTVGQLAAVVERALRAEQAAEALPLGLAPRGKDLPLSYPQQRMWLSAELDPASPAWNVPMMLRITGCLHVAALEWTLGEVVRRHEALRTTFHSTDHGPVQRLAPHRPLVLPAVDLRGLDEAARQLETLRLGQSEARTPFDLGRGPLLRATRLWLGEGEQVLLMTMHHIVTDGWSASVLEEEVMALYGSALQSRPSPLPELPIQYADFAYWQRRWLEEGALDGQRDYWRRRLSGVPPLLALPADHPRPARATSRGDFGWFVLAPPLAREVKKLGEAEGATLFMTLLSLFKALLFVATRQTDLVVGTDVANRSRSETEVLIGFFVNVLALRTQVPPGTTFRQLLARVRETALEAYAHQELPYEEVLKEAAAPSPLFNVFFLVENAATRKPFELPGAAISSMTFENPVAVRDLSLYAQEKPGGILCTWNYRREMFEAGTITRLSKDFQRLAEIVVAEPDVRLDQLDLLTGEEREQSLLERSQREQERLSRFKRIKPKGMSLA